MSTEVVIPGIDAEPAQEHLWLGRVRVLWAARRLLLRVTGIAFVLGFAIAFAIPKRYTAGASIMPPEQPGSNAMLLASMAARSSGMGSLGGLAGSLLGGRTTTALFVDLLHSGTITGALVSRFELQREYHARYASDAAKKLLKRTTVTEDRKSGVISIEVWDNDPVRARDLAAAYLEELNKLVNRTSTSAAHQERLFLDERLKSVQAALEQAQLALSEFSSRNGAIDLKEQTRATVEAAARVQAELAVEEGGLNSLRQIYGDSNVRVRESEARIATLRAQLAKFGGSAAASGEESGGSAITPPLRQVPRLAVPYEDLYRRVRIEETIYELLTQQYEIARIEEVKDVPVVSVIDAPGIPEKKSFPKRSLVILGFTAISFVAVCAFILFREHWAGLDEEHKAFALEVWGSIARRGRSAEGSVR